MQEIIRRVELLFDVLACADYVLPSLTQGRTLARISAQNFDTEPQAARPAREERAAGEAKGACRS
jgi:hypothetical protein